MCTALSYILMNVNIEKFSNSLKVDAFLRDFSENLAANAITFNAFKLKIYSSD